MRNVINGALLDLVDVGVDSPVSVTFSSNNVKIPFGTDTQVMAVRDQYRVTAEYNCKVSNLCPDEVQLLINLYQTVNGSEVAIPFNDVSDNTIFQWFNVQAGTEGRCLQFANDVNKYQICKLYSFADDECYRPISMIGLNTVVNLYDLNNTLISGANYSIDTNTGVITANPGTVPYFCEVDLFYTSVIFSSELTITPISSYGILSDAQGYEYTIEDATEDQRYEVSFNLQEVYPSTLLTFDVQGIPQSSTAYLPVFSSDYINISSNRSFRVNQYTHNGLILRQESNNYVAGQSYSISGHVVKHNELWFWICFARATGLTSAKMEP